MSEKKGNALAPGLPGVIKLLLVLSVLCASASVHAWNPRNNWEDSYAVEGQCYCNSSNYDHDLDTKSARTPLGVKNVVEICDDLRSALGTGEQQGRVPYNDIQCGHGPANNARDETGCPGRVDQGDAGCRVIGPRWNLERVYGPWPDACTASRRLMSNQWYMLSLPCDVQLSGKGSVREVLADDLGTVQFGSVWVLFELRSNGQYREMALNDQMRAGVGYWLMTTEDDRVIDIAGEYSVEVDVPLRSASQGAWSMIGTPFSNAVGWQNMELVDGDTGRVSSLDSASPDEASCASRPVSSSCRVANIGFKWTEAGMYEKLDGSGGSLEPFDAVWMFATDSGMYVRVPLPDQGN